MIEMTYRQVVARALQEEMLRDDTVFVLGEDIGAAGGVFKTTDGLLDTFGAQRVRDTPISEQAIIGCALGAAVAGLRPVAEIMFADFAGVCFDQIANQAAKYRFTTGGQAKVPLTIRLANGGGIGFGSQHSQSAENWFLNIPGLKICVPGTPRDLYGMMKAAIRDDNPVLIFEHKGLYAKRGPVPAVEELVPIGTAEVARRGQDVTIVATQLMRYRSLEAAERLTEAGIEAEVIDLRSLVPLDIDTVLNSVRKTGRLVCVQECPADGSWGASVIARIVQAAFRALEAAPALICTPDTPVPYSAALEAAWLPKAEEIAALASKVIHS